MNVLRLVNYGRFIFACCDGDLFLNIRTVGFLVIL